MHLPISEYSKLLANKTLLLNDLLSPYPHPEVEVHKSEPQNYRLRAEFRIWHAGDDFFHVMFDQSTGKPYKVTSYPQGSQLMNAIMVKIIPLLKTSPCLNKGLFQIEYLTTLNQKILVSLLYHKTLNAQWEEEAQNLRSSLRNMGFEVNLIGRASKQKICLNQDYLDEELIVNGKKYIYRQVENSFTQPNGGLNQQMLAWAQDCTKYFQEENSDLLELYCGNGNFSIALAQNFRQVLATEVSKSSVEAAQFNISANGIKNLQIIRMSAEDFTQALQGVRKFYRLRNVDLSQYNCQTILVDPPRAGLDPATLQLVINYANILYISCNPHTLVANLAEIAKTHRIVRVALFDQFPYTPHMEVGLWLQKK